MKIKKDNSNHQNNNIFNKTFTANNKNNLFKNKMSFHNSKKVSKYIAKINNYYNKNSFNKDNKIISNKNTKNIDITKKRASIPDNNFNFNKYIISDNKYQELYKSQKDVNKTIVYNQLNNSMSVTKNNHKNLYDDRLSPNSIYMKKSFNQKFIKAQDNLNSSYSAIQEKKDKIIKIFKQNKNISPKEEAFYILSVSPILRLSEQLIFSRASKNIRKVLTIESVFNNHRIFLQIKAKELRDEISLCEKRIRTPFSATKIADITLNFITSLDEQEFKDFDILETNKEYIKIYYAYMKLLYILFNLNYNNYIDIKKLKKNLYEKIKEKGFNHLRDYLYHIYIAKKENVNIISKIELINNEIICKYPDLLNIHETIKICRFTAFANYLIKEIINYGNNIKELFELKYKAQYLLEIVMGKIEKLKNKSSKRNKKK